MKKNKLVTNLNSKIIQLITIVAIQQIVIFLTLYLRDNISLRTLVVVTLVVTLVPIGYLIPRMISIVFSICWVALYSAWLFTFVDKPPLVAIGIIITVPILIMSANNLKNSKDIVNASYLTYIDTTRLQGNYVDPHYGFANHEAFYLKYEAMKRDYKQVNNLDYYLVGIKFSYYNQTVEHIGFDVFTDYVQETTSTIKRNVIFINEFYTLNHGFLGLIIPYSSQQDIIEISNQIKKYFHSNVKYDHKNNAYRISVQIGNVKGNNLPEDSLTKDELINYLLRRTEEDINAEYF